MKYAKVQQQKSVMRNSQAASAQTGKNGTIISDHRASSPIQKKANKTGLPDNLKSGIENLSGMAMDHVKVHYNSAKPASLQAHAYAQGSDIHVAPGQEKHLPHEAWHIVQQAKGRVKPTMQMAGGVPVNDNKGLEKEADNMGAKALQTVQRYGPDPEDELSHILQRKKKNEVSLHNSIPTVQKQGSDDEGDDNNQDEAAQQQGGRLSKRDRKLARSNRKARTTHGDTHLSQERLERAAAEAEALREEAKGLPKKEAKKLKKKAENILAAAHKDQLHRGGSGSSKN